MKNFEQRLTGGHPNSLGQTVEVVEEVLRDPERFDELFHCYFSDDDVVRLRTSNAMKRIAREREDLLLPYLDRLLTEIAGIDQASAQWTLAQLYGLLAGHMSADQRAQATENMKANIERHRDWIVLTRTMETLGNWARDDASLRAWLLPHLERIATDPRKAVAKKAKKTIQQLEGGRG